MPVRTFFGKINLSNSGTKSGSTTAQGSHTGELQKLKVLTHHSTESTPRGTLKTQSLHMPQHRTHAQGNFENSESSHATEQGPYREF